MRVPIVLLQNKVKSPYIKKPDLILASYIDTPKIRTGQCHPSQTIINIILAHAWDVQNIILKWRHKSRQIDNIFFINLNISTPFDLFSEYNDIIVSEV